MEKNNKTIYSLLTMSVGLCALAVLIILFTNQTTYYYIEFILLCLLAVNIIVWFKVKTWLGGRLEMHRAHEFVSLVAHQLQTPLSLVSWNTEMLLEGDGGNITAEQKEYLQAIYEGSQRMNQLIKTFLNVSRIEQEVFSIEPEPVQLEEVAHSILTELHSQIAARQLQIEEKYEPGLPAISVDQKLTRMIIENLITNAIKYTPPHGNINVHIGRDVSGANLVISVQDTGMGIPDNQKNKIFTKLFRADNVKVANIHGTGLGLYIVQAILDYAGGKIWFKSTESKGTTFYVSIPSTGMRKKEGTKQLS